MPLTVILTVGVDAWLIASQIPAWKSAGLIAVPAASIPEAIESFTTGDFDVVLVGSSIPSIGKERLTKLIRATGARTPVLSLETSAAGFNCIADRTIGNAPGSLLATIGELTARRAAHVGSFEGQSDAPSCNRF